MKRNKQNVPVLIVDDDISVVNSLELQLKSGGIDQILHVLDSRDLMPILKQREIGVILLDILMPHLSGDELLPIIIEHYPHIPVLMVTGSHDIAFAIKCMKLGAYDYLIKPVEDARLISSVSRALEMRELRWEYSAFKEKILSRQLDNPDVFSGIITRNPQMLTIFQYIETIALTDRPVLITGDSGVGKEMLARNVHTLSQRPGHFIAINVAGIDETVFSDTLFGHVKGAYTGADSLRKGLVEQAQAGTLFLDEIGDLNMPCQVKLLRLLQEKEFFPLGADLPKQSRTRLVMATNCDLVAKQRQGTFRTDLLFRLQTNQIHVPPLKKRLGDLPLLIDFFLEQAARELKKKKPTPPRELNMLLANYYFPGNIRELEGMIFEAVRRHTSKVLSLDYFREYIAQRSPALPKKPDHQPSETPFKAWSVLPSHKELSELLINEALLRTDGNKSAAAHLIGMTRSGLIKALQRKKQT
ncbi:sigma-54-dependent Fis family transcriptional regulator [bacterium]|nr:sigma-54-dependent Fis family transcriptional regulator [bacterium]